MDETIIIALITAGATIIGQYLLSKAQHDKDSAVLNERLDGIKTRLDTHNGYAEKIGSLADDMAEVKADMREVTTDVKWLMREVQK